MTTDIIELSKQAAEVLGVPAFVSDNSQHGDNKYGFVDVWLAEDAGRCAKIAADKRLDVLHKDDRVSAGVYTDNGYKPFVGAYLADHNNDRLKAYCVAVCRAVIEQAKGE